MARSIINIADNDYTSPSPCLKCHWHIQGIDKRKCMNICQRLEAYRNEKEYAHLPHPDISKLQDIEEGETEHPVLDKLMVKQAPKSNKQDVRQARTKQKTKKTKDSMPKTPKKVLSANEAKKSIPIKLYLTRYDKIRNYIFDQADETGLPPSHIALNLLAESINARKKQ